MFNNNEGKVNYNVKSSELNNVSPEILINNENIDNNVYGNNNDEKIEGIYL